MVVATDGEYVSFVCGERLRLAFARIDPFAL